MPFERSLRRIPVATNEEVLLLTLGPDFERMTEQHLTSISQSGFIPESVKRSVAEDFRRRVLGIRRVEGTQEIEITEWSEES